jgi:GNAT superfamily N-acetyltransferase
LWAVLKGNHTGKALVDDIQNPSQGVVRTDAALTYFSPQTNQDFLGKAVEQFRKSGEVWLVWPDKTTLELPIVEDAEIINRVEFFGIKPGSNDLLNLRNRLPVDFIIQTIDAEMLQHCEWGEEMAFYSGSPDNFLKHGIGLCMLHDKEIITEAYASSLGKVRAEIGAITREAHRGQGYAPIASAHLIALVEERGFEPYWSCDADNNASVRVAQKLGFQKVRYYKIYEYDAW